MSDRVIGDCPRCQMSHYLHDKAVDVLDPDDEIVACGMAHIERMDKRGVYVGLYAADGSFAQVWFRSTKGRLVMTVEEHDH